MRTLTALSLAVLADGARLAGDSLHLASDVLTTTARRFT